MNLSKIKTIFICAICHKTKPVQTSGGTGYAIVKNITGKVCYDCMGEIDYQSLRDAKPKDKFIFYITKKENGYHVINWCGTMDILPYYQTKSNHNFAGKNARIDVWFKFEGKEFWGVNIGDNEILHVKCLKYKK